MSERLQVVITGQNGVSRVFQEITRDATTMGAGVERASQTASQAITQFDETAAQSAAQTSARYEALGQAIGRIGLAFGAFDLLASRASGQAEASAARLQTAFQNAGFAVDDYQQQINQLNATGLHLGFDDEDVQDALARFVTTTKDVQQSIKDVALAEDIARGTGKSLAEATQIVNQAEAGRFRGLAQLGISLDSTATKQDYLAAAQQRYAGQADAYSQTSAAAFDRVKNSAENALEAVGGKLEGLQVPILALSSAATALGPLAKGIKEIASAEELAAVGSEALSIAMGPVGIAIAAVAAAGGIALVVKNLADYKPAADSAISATKELQDLLYSLAGHGASDSLTAPLKDVTDAWDVLAATAAQDFDKYEQVTAQITDLNATMQQQLAAGQFDQADATQKQIDALNAEAAALAKLQLSGGQIDSITKDIEELFNKPGIDAAKAGAAIEYYFDLFRQGKIDQDTLVSYIDQDSANWTRYSTAIITGSTALETNAKVSAMHTEARRREAQAEIAAADATAYHTHILDEDTSQTLIHDNARRRGMALEAEQTAGIQKQTGVIENQASTVGQTTSAITAYNESQKASIGYSFAATVGLARQQIALKSVSDTLADVNSSSTAGIPAVTQFGDELASQATSANATAAALSAQSSGYYDLAHSIGQAVTAQESFRNTQDDIIASEGVYGQQLSTYSSQVNEITAAHDLLNQKVADGGTLTQAETDFQNNYNEALERGNGAVDDATISSGPPCRAIPAQHEAGRCAQPLDAGSDERGRDVGRRGPATHQRAARHSARHAGRCARHRRVGCQQPTRLHEAATRRPRRPLGDRVRQVVHSTSGIRSFGARRRIVHPRARRDRRVRRRRHGPRRDGGIRPGDGPPRRRRDGDGLEPRHLRRAPQQLRGDRAGDAFTDGHGFAQVNITINGVGKSTEEILREMVPAFVQAMNNHYQGHPR
jgi:hypothetical protein